jgi:hypothetical protein
MINKTARRRALTQHTKLKAQLAKVDERMKPLLKEADMLKTQIAALEAFDISLGNLSVDQVDEAGLPLFKNDTEKSAQLTQAEAAA